MLRGTHRILKLRKFDAKTVNEYREVSQGFASKGFRSLGVAIKEDGKDWELLGIMSMFDPPRSDTAAVSCLLVFLLIIINSYPFPTRPVNFSDVSHNRRSKKHRT
jgi:hypothetical protein